MSQAWVGGMSPAAKEVTERVQAIAHSDMPVLITGESGTGKELVARALHEQSPRGAHRFVAVNCAAFPDSLLESELFGYDKGAFTGATASRIGRFRAADGGTLFLDEVAELSPSAQAKLLRVLQDHVVEPLGSDDARPVDVRVLSATHRDLKEGTRTGQFREDLYYRLRVLHVHLPALRDRKDDLPPLVAELLTRHAGGAIPSLTAKAWAALRAYPFPGNIRELENALLHALVISQGAPIDVLHLPGDVRRAVAEAQSPTDVTADLDGTARRWGLSEAVRGFERQYLVEALNAHNGNRSECARALGISRKSLWEKLRNYGINDS